MNEFLLTKFAESELKVGFESLPDVSADQSRLDVVLGVIFGLAGAVALLFLVIGGVRYVLSRGDPNATAQAKGTVLYSIVGLVVVILAFTIVRFVVSNV